MYNLDSIAAGLSAIAGTGSKLDKEYLLKKYATLEGFKEVLKFIYDPYFTTGLKIRKLENAMLDNAGVAMTVEEFMEYLKENSTGTAADAAIANGFIYGQEDPDAQWIAEAIATKDLQIGVNVTTLNKVFGKTFIPRIGIMRGMLCPDTISGAYIATEKIDGNRRVIMTKWTGVEIYTRSGRRDNGLIEIEEQAKKLPVGYVFDTECIAVGDFADSIELRQASASILNSRGKRKGVKALCFDMLPISDYTVGESLFSAITRKSMLAVLFGDEPSLDLLGQAFPQFPFDQVRIMLDEPYAHGIKLPNIEVLPILGVVRTKEQALKLAQPIWDTGGEGVMLVKDTSAYEVSPNPRKTLLKIKATKEYVCRCTCLVEGDNKYAGTLGAIEILYIKDDVEYTVKVGSGFTDYQRDYYWTKPESIVDKFVEVDAFGESRNAQGECSLSCPIFKRVVGTKE